MPRLVEYKQGSIVYFRGDRADKIFVLQSGAIKLVSENFEYNSEPVAAGEFFGVKSALGNYSREESANVVRDSRVMVFTVPEFEALCMNNTRIVMKMLKVFSNQLRQVNDQFASVLRESEAANSDDGLFGISEYFLKHTKYERAHYVLKEYIKEYPEGKNIVNAKKNFDILEKMKKGKNGW